jgi:TPR repeat protein
MARLGQCYQEGRGGLQKNEEEAEKLYKEGADHGNVLSLFLYGLLIAKKPERSNEAEALIKKAASAGLSSAIKWCKENNVTFTESDGQSQ